MLNLLYLRGMKQSELADTAHLKQDYRSGYACIKELICDGLISKSTSNFLTITEDGKEYVRKNIRPTPRTPIPFVEYKPAQWNIRIGSDAHLKIASGGWQ
jgi:hypothetical protein